MKNFFINYRRELLGLLALVLIVLGVTAVQAISNISVGIVVAVCFIIAYLLADNFLPNKEVQARSLQADVDQDVWTPRKAEGFIVYIGSFLIGMLIFFISGEEPADGFLPDTWGLVALAVTFIPPAIYSILRKSDNKGQQ